MPWTQTVYDGPWPCERRARHGSDQSCAISCQRRGRGRRPLAGDKSSSASFKRPVRGRSANCVQTASASHIAEASAIRSPLSSVHAAWGANGKTNPVCLLPLCPFSRRARVERLAGSRHEGNPRAVLRSDREGDDMNVDGWTVVRESKRIGPFSRAQLEERLRLGLLEPWDRIHQIGSGTSSTTLGEQLQQWAEEDGAPEMWETLTEDGIYGQSSRSELTSARSLGSSSRGLRVRRTGADAWVDIGAQRRAWREQEDVAYVATLPRCVVIYVPELQCLERQLNQAMFGGYIDRMRAIDAATALDPELIAEQLRKFAAMDASLVHALPASFRGKLAIPDEHPCGWRSRAIELSKVHAAQCLSALEGSSGARTAFEGERTGEAALRAALSECFEERKAGWVEEDRREAEAIRHKLNVALTLVLDRKSPPFEATDDALSTLRCEGLCANASTSIRRLVAHRAPNSPGELMCKVCGWSDDALSIIARDRMKTKDVVSASYFLAGASIVLWMCFEAWLLRLFSGAVVVLAALAAITFWRDHRRAAEGLALVFSKTHERSP